jgi:hypothetical protein
MPVLLSGAASPAVHTVLAASFLAGQPAQYVGESKKMRGENPERAGPQTRAPLHTPRTAARRSFLSARE